jgi:hypothetical protein
MSRTHVAAASFAAIVVLAVAPAANAWVLTTPQDPIYTENEPGIVPIGFATLDSQYEAVTGSCDDGTAAVMVGQPYWHAGSGTWRRNLAVDLNPPSGTHTNACELLDGTTTISGIDIEFTSAGIVIEFTSAG